MAKQTFLVPGIALVITGAIAFAIYQSRQPATTPPAPPPATIAAAEITTENWEPTLNSVGSLVAQNGINVSTEVSGIVSELAFSSGQSVSQGDVLVRLDLDVDKASLEALRAERKLARIQYNRASDLLKKKGRKVF